MAIAETLKATKELKDGVELYRPVTNFTLNFRPFRCYEIQQCCGTDGELSEGNE